MAAKEVEEKENVGIWRGDKGLDWIKKNTLSQSTGLPA